MSTIHKFYTLLYKAYGPQHWWPACTPFEVMVGAILTQNTAWVNVERAIVNLKNHHALSAEMITAVHSNRLAQWLKPSGYFNIKARRLKNFCRWYLAQGGYRALCHWDTAILREALLSVNGVGPETADDILLYAFQRPVFVVDAYTRRLFVRLGIISEGEGYEPVRRRFETTLKRVSHKVARFNEYHALIVKHGKDYCRIKPNCSKCCLRRDCPTRNE